ncbi:hypothetical protein CDIK_4462, partial [Cucumispora dikerogammari]
HRPHPPTRAVTNNNISNNNNNIMDIIDTPFPYIILLNSKYKLNNIIKPLLNTNHNIYIYDLDTQKPIKPKGFKNILPFSNSLIKDLKASFINELSNSIKKSVNNNNKIYNNNNKISNIYVKVVQFINVLINNINIQNEIIIFNNILSDINNNNNNINNNDGDNNSNNNNNTLLTSVPVCPDIISNKELINTSKLLSADTLNNKNISNNNNSNINNNSNKYKLETFIREFSYTRVYKNYFHKNAFLKQSSPQTINLINDNIQLVYDVKYELNIIINNDNNDYNIISNNNIPHRPHPPTQAVTSNISDNNDYNEGSPHRP